MLPRRLAAAAALAWLAGGCVPNSEVSFEPLPEGVGSSPIASLPLAGAGGAGAAGQAGAGTTLVDVGGSDTGTTQAAGSASGGTSAAGAEAGGTPSAGTDTGGGGAVGVAGAMSCSVGAWSSRDYAMGERVTSVCEAPYNGLCSRGERHEFECRPPTGLVGLAWCRAREPGVGNGWNEAWLLKLPCPS